MNLVSVFSPARYARLLAGDGLNAARDPILAVATIMSLAPPLLLFVLRDRIDAAAFGAFGLPGFALYLVPFALCLPALLIGWVTGMLLLEDRDDGPALAIAVTPVGRAGFLAYRASASALLAGLIAIYGALLVLQGAGAATMLLLALLVGAEAVVAASLLPALARNRVEGLAITKLVNLATIVPLAALLPAPWRWAFGIVPTYWLGELTLLPPGEALPFAWLAALAVHAAWLYLAFRLFRR